MQDLLRAAIQRTSSGLCLGIDPVVSSSSSPLKFQTPIFWTELIAQYGEADGIKRWAMELLAISAPLVPAVKFQSAFFEALGWQGWRCLEELCHAARRLGLITIVDGKRGDISTTMAAYGAAIFDRLQADIMTVQPYLGFDVLRALTPWLRRGRGVYLVWLTSNPSYGLVQAHPSVEGTTLAEDLIPLLEKFLSTEDLVGRCGLVLGATRLGALKPEVTAKLEEFPLLIPGLGEQGGETGKPLRDLLRGRFLTLLPMSRGLTGVGSSELQQSIANISRSEYFAWYEGHLRRLIGEYA